LPIEYEISYKLYKTAQWLYLKKRPASMVFYIVLYWLIPLAGLVCLFLTLADFLEGRRFLAWTLLKTELPFIVYGLIVVIWRQISLRRGYSGLYPRNTQKRATFSYDEQQCISAIPGRSQGKVYWSAMSSVAQDKQITLLFMGRKRFLMVPTQSLSAQEWSAIRGYIAANKPA
jgi:hypothetical protein